MKTGVENDKNPLLEVFGDGCAQSIVFQLIAFLVLLGIFIVPSIVVAIVIGDQNSNLSLFIWILIALVMVGLVSAFIWARTSIRQRAQRLDEVFKPWGLNGDAYLQFGRQYHGEIKGRHADIYFRRGPSLEIEITTKLDARAVFIFKSEINKLSTSLRSFEDVALNNPSFHNLAIYAQDRYWMDGILETEVTRSAVRRLMKVTSAYELRQILIEPQKIKMSLNRVPFDEINSESINAWIEDVFTLLRAVEAAPAPQAPTVLIPIEVELDEDRRSTMILSAAVAGSVLAALCICTLTITVAALITRSMLAP